MTASPSELPTPLGHFWMTKHSSPSDPRVGLFRCGCRAGPARSLSLVCPSCPCLAPSGRTLPATAGRGKERQEKDGAVRIRPTGVCGGLAAAPAHILLAGAARPVQDQMELCWEQRLLSKGGSSDLSAQSQPPSPRRRGLGEMCCPSRLFSLSSGVLVLLAPQRCRMSLLALHSPGWQVTLSRVR